VVFDDTTRHAYVEVLSADQQGTAIGFLRRALTWFNGQGIECRQVMSDNGSAFVSKAFSLTLASGVAATATDEDYRDEAGPEIPSNREWDDTATFPKAGTASSADPSRLDPVHPPAADAWLRAITAAITMLKQAPMAFR